MTPNERFMIEALHKCSFLPGSYPKRFVQDMNAILTYNPGFVLSERQYDYLVLLFHKYRKQHGKHVDSKCPVCQKKKSEAEQKELEKAKKWSGK